MLKYLFEAHLNAGSIICQQQEDVSTIDPSKSAWFDVIQKIGEVRRLLLVRYMPGLPYPTVAAVDMANGLFALNGNEFHAFPFTQADCAALILSGGQFLPQYFMRVTQFLNPEGLGGLRSYAIGWQYVKDGKTVANQVVEIY